MATLDVENDAALADVLERMADELRLVGTVDVEGWRARYPELASEIVRLVPTLGLLVDLSAGQGASQGPTHEADGTRSVPATLGDFRIVRELGRGGMGIVYEAEQLSLNRRVALKILPTAAVLDPRTLQRFKNEAQAAAGLDHPHIVDVYGVGVERGVHYYAMRLIDGCTVAELIEDLRGIAGGGASKVESRRSKTANSGAGEGARGTASGESGARQETRAARGLSTFATQESLKSQRFFRSVAELGMHVAEGLAHAHEQGIIHRDIKPSNLLVDGQGKVWLTDFGLAHIEANPTLTASGDLLGTLRYMSPEQTLANRAPIDHRTDIYSLGATLYELVTLTPVFGESERAALIQKIAFGEPLLPRKINPRVPADLETILLRMLEKDPGGRYATADELAADLRRFIENQPIHARRRSVSQRLIKWASRHRGVVAVGAAAVLMVIALTGVFVGWQWRDAAARQALVEHVAASALEAAAKQEGRGDWAAALIETRRAEAALAALSGTGTPLADSVTQRLRDEQMAIRLDNVRLLAASIAGGDFDFETADRAYAAAFAEYGIDIERSPKSAAVEAARKSRIAEPLADALTNWAIVRMRAGSRAAPRWQELLKLAKEIDPDPWRNRVRDAYLPERLSADELRDLILRAPLEKLPRSTLFLLVQAAGNRGVSGDDVAERLRSLQRQFTDDFWINFATARYFEQLQPPNYEEALRFYSVALGQRPESAAARSNLGVALVQLGRAEEAAAEFARAVASEPQFLAAYSNWGHVLLEQEQAEQAEHILRQALAISDVTAEVQYNLGRALLAQEKSGEAARAFQRALEIRPSFALARQALEQCAHEPR